MIKTCTHYPGHSRGLGLRKVASGLLAATFLIASAGVAHADVFGGAAPATGPANPLLERLTALERELKELKEKGVQSAPAVPGAPVSGKSAASPTRAHLKMTPPPGLEGLPGGGTDERERLLVEKELTYEVLGTVNGMLVVRDGENRLAMSETEFKEFEKKKREKVIRRMKLDSLSEGERLSFPELTPPPPPPVPDSSALAQAGAAVGQARSLEANGGQLPSPPPAMKPATPAMKPATNPAVPAVAPVNALSGPNKPAAPVKKN